MPTDQVIRMVGYLGAAANWLIPIAAMGALRNDPKNVDVKMSAVLSTYSFFFIRWALAISPANYPLCACHFTNSSLQAIHTARGIRAQYS
eukprot:CAMPEP_0174285606 /NCGR_PEP_ID=MMETSP0809-20121228/9001_1 /TAXON_ID=73025 ORGANISM="Eutreptiella gymnastica-like, Strain CCMP1594" /NCGR_SAMPLE_ID=MMETSP0809 /ASSEMBLY_ACC=CAM_ASM_000658 /LENGTH=89 /DNA_ID=CAMNT_0015381419 /DNA_START=24 /DNA_END=293 /DNA_ORIENTATION=+